MSLPVSSRKLSLLLNILSPKSSLVLRKRTLAGPRRLSVLSASGPGIPDPACDLFLRLHYQPLPATVLLCIPQRPALFNPSHFALALVHLGNLVLKFLCISYLSHCSERSCACSFALTLSYAQNCLSLHFPVHSLILLGLCSEVICSERLSLSPLYKITLEPHSQKIILQIFNLLLIVYLPHQNTSFMRTRILFVIYGTMFSEARKGMVHKRHLNIIGQKEGRKQER